ncbi:sensor histidine kinase [Microlunatus sp. GCM10028923]|uniref:sensor histidine kinase n=1 Tax=Microlunatus sp. GCM10028923 TaxID=3273400 RepID=UPI00360A8C5C
MSDGDSRARPIVSLRPFLVIAVALFLATTVAFTGLVYHEPFASAVLLAVAVGAGLAVPVVVAWFRPVFGWALSLPSLLLLLPIDRWFSQDIGLESYGWLTLQAASHVPVIYVLALSTRRRICYPAVAITLVAASVGQLNSEFSQGDVFQTAVILVLIMILTVLVARFQLHRRHARDRIAEEEGLRRVLEERARIARELHDVVAHHMSIIAVQASTAPYRLDPGRPDVVDEFQSIGASARASLQELRQLLDVLRGTGPAAMPGLAELPKLAESARVAGVQVELIIDGEAGPGSEAGSTAYRIVQEALSNVVRHAPGAATVARITAEADALVVEVINEPSRQPVRPTAPGHGLTGMRERVTATGGALRTGPTPNGGFRVEARLPLRAEQ